MNQLITSYGFNNRCDSHHSIICLLSSKPQFYLLYKSARTDFLVRTQKLFLESHLKFLFGGRNQPCVMKVNLAYAREMDGQLPSVMRPLDKCHMILSKPLAHIICMSKYTENIKTCVFFSGYTYSMFKASSCQYFRNHLQLTIVQTLFFLSHVFSFPPVDTQA